MKVIPNQVFAPVFLLCLSLPLPAQTLRNPIGASSGNFAALASSQFLGARFSLATPTALDSVGGEFRNLSGSFFVALVPLSSMTDLPNGNPGAGIPFNPGEVLAYRTFEANVDTRPRIITTPFSINLSPGVYGVIFGTGLYDTQGYSGVFGGMPLYGRVAGSSSFFWSSEPWRWQDCRFFPAEEFNILITVPEPSYAALLAVGLAASVLGRGRGLRVQDAR
jgi:hypothetical protein